MYNPKFDNTTPPTHFFAQPTPHSISPSDHLQREKKAEVGTGTIETVEEFRPNYEPRVHV
jgi:hypothetical protein